jgi:hypothetical protein
MVANSRARRPVTPSLFAAAALAVGLAACAGQGDVNRVQADAIDKGLFFNADGTPRTFYYRKTTVGVPPTSAYTFEGMMGDLEKVRFDIKVDGDPTGAGYLVGYRSYDYATGSEGSFNSGTNNQDTPFLVFKITSQFDIKREYNPATGEQTNVISENTTDRPWNERQFMRVDWSSNLADPKAAPPATDPMNPFVSTQTIDTGFAIGEGEQALVNPDRPIITASYIDFTTQETRTPDYAACLQMFDTYDDAGPWNCGPSQINYRNALLPAAPSNYETLYYPDRQALLDGNGEPFQYAVTPDGTQAVNCDPATLAQYGLSGDDCVNATVDQFAKFGFFRTVRPGYDPKVGAAEQNRQYLINRWNIWKNELQLDASGNPIIDSMTQRPKLKPPEQRDTNTITYYLSVTFPDDPVLAQSAQQVVDDWDEAARETVAAIKLTAGAATPASLTQIKTMAGTLPKIFLLAKNDCRIDNVNTFLGANPDVKALIEKQVSSATLDLDNITSDNLLQACSAMSAVTEDRADGDAKHPKFVWQRNGDLRYSFLYWVDRPQPAGPLGYGPMSADPETGEVISAAAYIYGAALNTYAQFAAESVDAANGSLSVDDILSGKTISDVLAESRKMTTLQNAQKLSTPARTMAQAKLASLGTQAQRLVKIGAGIDDQALASIKGTPLQNLLLNDDIIPAIVPGYRPGDTPPADLFDQAMAQPWLSSQAREARHQRMQTFAENGCVYMAEFADDAILGTAIRLSGQHLTGDALYQTLRATIFRGLADHEMGHTIGLRHNFSASTDALNYDDQFWTIRQSVSPDKWEDSALSEYEYASVMDYGSRFNSDIQGLGKYDMAAFRFGYGQLIDVIPQASESIYTRGASGNSLPADIFYSDYSKIPAEVGGIAKVATAATGVVPYQQLSDYFLGKAPNAPAEKPYKFCSDEFEGSYDCKTWDKGANQQEIVNSATEMFRNYYAFNAFKRDRTTWDMNNYLTRIETHYLTRYTEAFDFFFFYGDAYYGTDFSDDLQLASMDAVNALGDVLQTPEPGLHCPTVSSPNVAVVPVDQYGNVDDTQCLTAPSGQAWPMYTIPDAKPYFINLSPDYYYRITRVGSLYEKLEALFTLTSTEARFFRIDTFADANRYSVNFYRIFRDQIVNLLSGVIRAGVGAPYTGTMAQDTTGFGTFQSTPVVDTALYGMVNPPTPAYAQPTAIHVDTPVNKTIQYYALLLGLGRLSSTWDTTLDFQNFLTVAVKGSNDDFTVTPSMTVKEFTHPETGVIYHAPVITAGPQNIGAQLIDELNTIVGNSTDTNVKLPLSIGAIPPAFGGATDWTTPLPNWYCAKSAVASAQAANDQTAYTNAVGVQTLVEQLMSYRVDLIGDIRSFRKQLLLP